MENKGHSKAFEIGGRVMLKRTFVSMGVATRKPRDLLCGAPRAEMWFCQDAVGKRGFAVELVNDTLS